MCCASRRGALCVFGVALLTLGLGFAGCTPAPDPWKDAKVDQKHVLATFAPLYCFAHAVAGDDAYVLCFLTDKDPHSYTFNAADTIKARGADLIVLNGLSLDNAFVEKLIVGKKIATLSAEKAIPKNMLFDAEDDGDKKDGKHEHGQEGHHHHHHGSHDPHVWLGPPQAIKIVEKIAAKLAEIDPPHADGYQKRAAVLRVDLEKLQADGKAMLGKGKTKLKVVSMHDSMSYFADAFDIEIVGVIQELPGQDPDGKKLADLVVKASKEKNIHVITYESQSNKAQSELLQKQLKGRGVDVQLAEFDPIEKVAPGKDGVNPDPDVYMKKMRANLEALAKALP